MDVKGPGLTWAMGMMAKALQVEAGKANIITQTFKALEKMETPQMQMGTELPKAISGADGKGTNINTFV